MPLLLAFLIGVFAGLRSLTAPAVTAWAMHLGWLNFDKRNSWIGSLPLAIILTVFAIGELIVDKLPKTPSRTALMGLIARIVTGGLCGACVAAGAAHEPYLGAILGAIGGVVGCFGGYFARTRVVRALGVRDMVVAVGEDLIAIAGCLWVVTRF